MTAELVDYFDLPSEDTWIEYLRTRLPYSFHEIREERCKGKKRHYILSRPVLSVGLAEYHNFWKRGYVYYAAGKLIDVQRLPSYWNVYHTLYRERFRTKSHGIADYLMHSAHDAVNALQLEKLWAFAARDHLDRERVVMTNITQAMEYCLKAIRAHAEYRQTGEFSFTEGHDLNDMFNALPSELRQEVQKESVSFAEDYTKFREAIEEWVSQLNERRFASCDLDAWKRVSDQFDHSNYTGFVNDNDPKSVRALGCGSEDWFDIAISEIRESTYHKYSPIEGKDEYPVTPIHRALMLGRFMYEYLFPVAAAEQSGS